MTGRTSWWAKDSAWWRRERIVALGLEFGPLGPAVIDWLECEAQAQSWSSAAGAVKTGYRAIAHATFAGDVPIRPLVSRAVSLGLLDDFEDAGDVFTCRISGWADEQKRATATVKKREQRSGGEPETPVDTDASQNEAAVVVPAGPDLSPSVPIRPLTEQNRTEQKEEQLPALDPSIATLELTGIYDAWLTATDRNPSKTHLSPKRRQQIKTALKSHGYDDCLMAVENIGRSIEARTGYGRGTRFDDISHALGDAGRIEKWRDWKPPLSVGVNGVNGNGNGNHAPTDKAAAREARYAERAAAAARAYGGTT